MWLKPSRHPDIEPVVECHVTSAFSLLAGSFFNMSDLQSRLSARRAQAEELHKNRGMKRSVRVRGLVCPEDVSACAISDIASAFTLYDSSGLNDTDGIWDSTSFIGIISSHSANFGIIARASWYAATECQSSASFLFSYSLSKSGFAVCVFSPCLCLFECIFVSVCALVCVCVSACVRSCCLSVSVRYCLSGLSI